MAVAEFCIKFSLLAVPHVIIETFYGSSCCILLSCSHTDRWIDRQTDGQTNREIAQEWMDIRIWLNRLMMLI